jgi:uncharacterized membrane protein
VLTRQSWAGKVTLHHGDITMRAAFLVLLSLFAAAVAQADVSYGVFGVRPGDVLNMRAQANPRAPVVVTIPQDATGITLTGKTAPSDWVEVTYKRKRGWVNGRFLGFGATGRWQLPAYLDCAGTEPFWSIALIPGQARADLMFAERRRFFKLTRANQAMNRSDIWHIRASNRPGEMSLIVRHETCSDGMSDTRFPYSAIALISGQDMIAGCCRPAVPRG